jgi:O-antigen/teichoic acid export membrane protein
MNNEVLVKSRLISAVHSNVILQPLSLVIWVAGSVLVARILGPELFAIINAISAIVVMLTTFLDFGISKSLHKILPDLSVKYGRQAAISAMQSLLKWKLGIVLLGFLVVLTLKAFGVVLGPARIAAGAWALPLVGVSAILSTVSGIWQSAAIASFHHSILNRVSLGMSTLIPAVSVAVVLLYRNPYLVVFASQCILLLQFLFIVRLARYDLDDAGGKEVNFPVSWRNLLHLYGRYCGMTYIAFLYNRFVFSASLIVWILSSTDVGAAVVANAALAMMIVGRVFDIANLPVNQIQGPLMARLFAECNEERFARTQRFLVSILCVTSGGLALLAVGLGPVVLSLLYGSEYGSAVRWGVFGAVLAMLGNPCSLGSTTLMQRERLRPIFVGFVSSAVIVIIGTYGSVKLMDPPEMGFGLILTVLSSRVSFFLVTDLWCDATVFKWEGSFVKLRAFCATTLSTALILLWGWNLPDNVAWGFPLGVLIWLVVWRLMGGLGKSTRARLEDLLGPGLRPLVRYL